jgi:hypothetical protein
MKENSFARLYRHFKASYTKSLLTSDKIKEGAHICRGHMGEHPGLRPRPHPLHAAPACPLHAGSRDILRTN